MIIQRLFRSGNTLRITLPRPIRRALEASCGDSLMLSHTGPGRVVITNLSAEARAPRDTVKKP